MASWFSWFMLSSKTLTNELQLQLTNYEKNKLFEINELDLSIQQLQEHNQLQGINDLYEKRNNLMESLSLNAIKYMKYNRNQANSTILSSYLLEHARIHLEDFNDSLVWMKLIQQRLHGSEVKYIHMILTFSLHGIMRVFTVNGQLISSFQLIDGIFENMKVFYDGTFADCPVLIVSSHNNVYIYSLEMKINNRLKSGKNKKNMKYLKIIDPMDAIDVSMEANKQLAIKVYEQQIFYASNNMTVSTIFGITHTFKKHPIVFIGYSNGVLRRYNIDGSIYNELVIPHQLSIQKILQWKHRLVIVTSNTISLYSQSLRPAPFTCFLESNNLSNDSIQDVTILEAFPFVLSVLLKSGRIQSFTKSKTLQCQEIIQINTYLPYRLDQDYAINSLDVFQIISSNCSVYLLNTSIEYQDPKYSLITKKSRYYQTSHPLIQIKNIAEDSFCHLMSQRPSISKIASEMPFIQFSTSKLSRVSHPYDQLEYNASRLLIALQMDPNTSYPSIHILSTEYLSSSSTHDKTLTSSIFHYLYQNQWILTILLLGLLGFRSYIGSKAKKYESSLSLDQFRRKQKLR